MKDKKSRTHENKEENKMDGIKYECYYCKELFDLCSECAK